MRRVLTLPAVLAAAVALGAPAAQAGFAPGECTTWAFLMRPDIVVDAMLAKPTLRNWNADHWAVNAQSAGFRVGTRPAVGAIVVWPAHVDGAGSVGHVAYVEQVKPDGSFYVSEENYAGSPAVHRRWITKTAGSVRFVYLQPGQGAPTAPLDDRVSLTDLSATGTYVASQTRATDVEFELAGPGLVALRLTGPNVSRTLTWSFKAGTWSVGLDQIAGSEALAAGTYTLTVMQYSTKLASRYLRFQLS